MPSLRTGTVTFLFTDIEGSTTLLQHLGDRRYAEILAEHQRLLREAFASGNGQEIDTQGDAFLVAFSRARDAVAAAVAAQQVLIKHTWPDGASLHVRMGLHTGEPLSGGTGYVGIDVHRAARIAAAGHGGQILVSDATHGLVSKDLPEGVGLRDLGEHRLKDLAHPHRLFQILAADLPVDFPKVRSLDAHRHNLPIQLSSFIGREKEIVEIKRLLGTARLVTLTGSGGAGKTRLGLQLAADLIDEHPDGVWLVEFAPIADPALVPKAVASALNVSEQPGRPLTETVADYLRPRALLLLLDNCEHLLQVCADLADTLLRTCPSLRILATSRESLGIAGELTYRVPSLSLPNLKNRASPETLFRYEAVRLFVERAAFSKPGFQITDGNAAAVARVTYRLDGIPLAIELAAARVKALPVDVIATRLDDQFRILTGGSRTGLPHHQTLRATLDWSYDLLSEPERGLLRRLSVFAGGFMLEAAERICASDGAEGGDILDLLTRLVDKSLIVFDEGDGKARYRLLEIVRQYGRDKLEESGKADDVRRRHRDWYVTLAERIEPNLIGPEQVASLEQLEIEHDNLRTALEYDAADVDSAEKRLRLAGALVNFWWRTGHLSEGRKWLEAALVRGSKVPSSSLMKCIPWASIFAWRQGDYTRATTLAERGITLSRELGDKQCLAWCLFSIGEVAQHKGDYVRAIALFEESLVLAREVGDRIIIGFALYELGLVALAPSDTTRAEAFLAECLSLFKEVGDIWAIALILATVALAALHNRDYQRAVALYAEGLASCRDLGGKTAVTGDCLEGLAIAACAQGSCDRAARIFGAADVLTKTLGLRRGVNYQARVDKYLGHARAALGEAAFAAAWTEGRAMTLEQAIEYALTPETG